VISPLETIHPLETPIENQRLYRWTHVTGTINGKSIGKLRPHFSKPSRVLEKLSFTFRTGNSYTGTSEARMPLDLFSMMVRQKHTILCLHPDHFQVVENRSVSHIDEDGSPTISDDKHIAGIGPAVDRFKPEDR